MLSKHNYEQHQKLISPVEVGSIKD